MEVVSPRLDTKQHVSGILGDFWEAMRVHFSPQRDISCGGHVHVTPVSGQNKFSLRGLKKIAFASAVYEEFVAAVLPKARRENQYCRPNSQSMGSGLRETLIRFGKSKGSLLQVASEIKSTTSEGDLCYYMQGNRYVLWNFQNIFPNPKTGKCTGTVEFRGGNQFLSTKGTLAWVAFVMGFITLALEEVSHLNDVLCSNALLTSLSGSSQQAYYVYFTRRPKIPGTSRRLVETDTSSG